MGGSDLGEGRSGGSAASASLAFAAVALGSIVAVASRGSWDHDADGAGVGIPDGLKAAFVLALVTLGAAILIAAIVLRPPGKRTIRQRTTWQMWAARIAVAAVAIAALLLLRRVSDDGSGSGAGGGSTSETTTTVESASDAATGGGSTVVVVVLALAAAVAAVVALRRPRSLGEVVADEPDGTGAIAESAIARAIADARRESDPRRAVLAAYAGMEDDLATSGLPRRPSEAPMEYLSRILDRLAVSGPAARRLTDLFERVGFGPHDVVADDRDQALAALNDIGTELAHTPGARVSRRVKDAARIAVWSGIVVVVAVTQRDHRTTALVAWVFVLAALAARQAVAGLVEKPPPTVLTATISRPAAERPVQLTKLERLVVIAMSDSSHGRDEVRAALARLADDLQVPPPALSAAVCPSDLAAALDELEHA